MSSSPVFSDGELVEAFSDCSEPALPIVTMPEEMPAENPDGYNTFKVENTLYRVAVDLFNESPKVKEKIRQAQAEGGGRLDSCPIHICGVTTYEMDCLLDVAEPRNLQIPFNKFDLEVLRTALNLATTLEMPDLQSHIIKLREGMEPPEGLVQKLRLADEFDIAAWKNSVYQMLWERCEPIFALSDEEGDQLGVRRCLALCRVREGATTIENEPALNTSNIPPPFDLSAPLPVTFDMTRNRDAVRHSRYYFESVVLQIEGKPYHVPRYIFSEGRGSEDTLKEVAQRLSWSQLDAVLDSVRANGTASPSTENDFERLSSALEAATALRLRSIKSYLVQQIETLRAPPSSVSLISLAERCRVHKWLKPQYVLLCTRPGALTLEEGEALGMRRVIAVNRIRDEITRAVSNGYYAARISRSSGDAERSIDCEPCFQLPDLV